MRSFDDELLELSAKSLKRELRWVNSAQGSEVLLNDQQVVNFASNDYLGLSTHPDILQAMKVGVDRWGAGSTASRLITGSMTPHGELEEYIAKLKGCEAALSFSTGYSASVATVGGLVGKGDTVILDKLAHASLIDGARLSGATVRVFPHNGLKKLERLLVKSIEGGGRVLVIVESVYSMDGDLALLEDIVDLKRKHGAMLLVDEAHGLGVYGSKGLGLIEHLGGISESVDIHMGTLGKAAGVAGGYIAGSRSMIDLVINKGRAFIYSTAPPPSQAVAAKKALEILTSEEGAQLRSVLWGNLEKLASSLSEVRDIKPTSAIVPWHIGEVDEALHLSKKLLEKGFFVPAIRYPTVPHGTARLRITVTAQHRGADIERLVNELSSSVGS